MTAREKFKKGQRVQLSDAGIRAGLSRKALRQPLFGVVADFGYQDAFIIGVIRDGRESPESYHMDFWEPAAPSGTGVT